ncbi:MFS transporter [Salinicola halophyticus]|uniref:MFS transporter n=1 Tax=Salinicola halophyticus TaxID=1808881 RepID=UPI003F45FD47
MTSFGNGRNTIWRLAVASALAGAQSTVIFATAAVLGAALAPDPAMATLPVSIFIAGMAGSTLPAGYITARFGRRATYMLGSGTGILSGLVGAAAIALSSFAMFCIATLMGGMLAAVALSFRFAAAECVPENARAKALTNVLIGGVFSGLLGGEMVTTTIHLVPKHDLAGTYLISALFALISMALLAGANFPRPAVAVVAGRPLKVVARQPLFLSAVISGAIIYLLMNFLMTSAPLAMHMHGMQQYQANFAVQWHVVAMYAPSFISGWLISRLGSVRVTVAGLVITAVAAVIGLTGETFNFFTLSLLVLGVGWNLGFSGASAMVLDTHRPEERAKVQALNDFIAFGTVMLGSFLSGGVLLAYGWTVVCWLAFPPIAMALSVLWLFRRPVG